MSEYKIHLSDGNVKVPFLNISLPPVLSCPKNIPCARDCYAMKAWRMYPSVRAAWGENWEFVQHDIDGYFSEISQAVTRSRRPYFRWHVAGDIPSRSYLQGMISLAKVHAGVNFLAYTKTDYWKEKLPSNLIMLHSLWLDQAPEKSESSFKVYFKASDIPASTKRCAGDCRRCHACYHAPAGAQIGVVLH